MFDGFKGSSGLAKMMTIFVVGILLGLGLCGLSASLEAKHSSLASGLLAAGGVSFWVSGLGLIVMVFCLLVLGLGNKER
jgi:hypothetical protein